MRTLSAFLLAALLLTGVAADVGAKEALNSRLPLIDNTPASLTLARHRYRRYYRYRPYRYSYYPRYYRSYPYYGYSSYYSPYYYSPYRYYRYPRSGGYVNFGFGF